MLIRLIHLVVPCSALLLGACATSGTRVAATDPEIRHYQLKLEPDLATQSVQGRLSVTVNSKQAAFTLKLDAHALQVDAVEEEGRPLPHSSTGESLSIQLPASPARGSRTVDIRYRVSPQRGMVFLKDKAQIYTAFSTSHWMPCDEQPASRATFELSLNLPADWQVAGSGERAREPSQAGDKRISTWVLDEPHACYLYGFVAGRFREVTDDSARPLLRYLVPPTLSETDTRKVFAETRSMIRFYEDKSGFAYPARTYTQALVGGNAAQEMAGMGIFGEGYAKRVLEAPQAVWLGAHELSHQWWGNRITNAAWTHFWLNEGIATFMNAAWFEHRFGAEAYERQLEGARKSYQRVVSAGKDKPLVFTDWKAPTREDRALVYDKGALAVARLREILRDKDFWDGIRLYSRRHRGESVATQDFQKAMEDASGKDLQVWFRAWAYGGAAQDASADPR